MDGPLPPRCSVNISCGQKIIPPSPSLPQLPVKFHINFSLFIIIISFRFAINIII